MARAPEVHDEDVARDGRRQEVDGRDDRAGDPHLQEPPFATLQTGLKKPNSLLKLFHLCWLISLIRGQVINNFKELWLSSYVLTD